MFYWLFKRYMRRFTAEYRERFEEELKRNPQAAQMTPNWYWVERLFFAEKRNDKE